jgi:hypothetical protein
MSHVPRPSNFIVKYFHLELVTGKSQNILVVGTYASIRDKTMKMFTGIIFLICGLYCMYSAIKSLSAGKTEDREDGFPPIRKKKSPVKFYLYIFSCMALGIALTLISAIMLWVQLVKQ